MPDPSTGSGGTAARVGIVMGSDSDWPVMSAAATALAEFDVPYAADVVSAHRMPDAMIDYGRGAAVLHLLRCTRGGSPECYDAVDES